MQFGAKDCKQSAIERDANSARLGGRYPDRASIVRFAPRHFGALAEFGPGVVGGPNFALTALHYFAADRASSSAHSEIDRPDEMPNVIEFREKAPGSRGLKCEPVPASVDAAISKLTSHVIGLQSKARGDICNAIFMLDLAAQHAREVAKRMPDPTARNDFDEHIATIERLLELARGLAVKL